MKKIVLLLFLSTQLLFSQNKFTISGYAKEKGSQEQLIGVNIYVSGTGVGTTSNTFGYYSLTLPKADTLTIVYSFVGYERIVKRYKFTKNILQDVFLQPTNQLSEVVVSGKRENERVSETPQMSQIEIPIQQIKKIPAFMGEKDVLKVLQLMPGVQKGSEGQAGIYVRGGGPDQNLLILDDAVVYNANHLFGFFSVFNGDALKSVELTKGGFPARFGGRLSSVIEMNMKEGNKEKLHGEGGIGLIASRLMLEGPIKKNKSSFLISVRRTYLDIVAKPFISYSQRNNPDKTTGGYYFYDLNAKLNYDLNANNKVYLSGYFGQDRFNVSSLVNANTANGGLFWGNATGTLRFNHLYNQKLFSNTSVIFSNYQFQIGQESSETVNDVESKFKLNYDSRIRDWNIKHDFDFYPNPNHSIKFGAQAIFHRFEPSAIVVNAGLLNTKANADIYNVLESGLYAEDTWSPLSRLKVNLGLRVSYFKTQTQHYLRPEPRIGAALKLADGLALKASYAKMNQFVHLLSNTSVGLPTDLWVPTTDKIKPEQSQQWAAGFAKDLDKQGLTLTVEGYYKTMKNIVAYKEGSSFININLNPDNPNAPTKINWEDNITAGKGYSYGLEFMLQKKVGRFSGWVGYTWSRTRWQFEELNFGKEFYPRYDRRHDISLVGIYDLNKRVTCSAVWVYGTGNALTMPTSQIYLPVRNIQGQFNPSPTAVDALQLFNIRRVQEYGEKNAFRAEPYHRLDLSVQLHRQKKNHERTWEFSAYNAYNRRNPFFYQIRNVTSKTDPTIRRTVLQRVSLFPVVPSITYAFKF